MKVEELQSRTLLPAGSTSVACTSGTNRYTFLGLNTCLAVAAHCFNGISRRSPNLAYCGGVCRATAWRVMNEVVREWRLWAAIPTLIRELSDPMDLVRNAFGGGKVSMPPM